MAACSYCASGHQAGRPYSLFPVPSTVPPLTARWEVRNSRRRLRSGIRRAASFLLTGLALSACLAAQEAGGATPARQPTLKPLAALDSAKPDHRRFFLETATFSLRGKYSVDDRVTNLRRDSQVPYTVALKGKLLLSSKGRLSLNGVLGTGNRFNRGILRHWKCRADHHLDPRQLHPCHPLEAAGVAIRRIRAGARGILQHHRLQRQRLHCRPADAGSR